MKKLPEDPVILLSFINTKLRDFYSDLDELCEDMNIDRDQLERLLKGIDYTYDESGNRFI